MYGIVRVALFLFYFVFQTTGIYFSHNSGSREVQDQGADWFAPSSVPLWRERALPGVSSHKDTNPINRVPPSRLPLNLLASQRTHLQILSHQGLGIQHINMRGHYSVQSTWSSSRSHLAPLPWEPGLNESPGGPATILGVLTVWRAEPSLGVGFSTHLSVTLSGLWNLSDPPFRFLVCKVVVVIPVWTLNEILHERQSIHAQ